MSDGGGPGYQEFEYYIKLNKLLVLTGVSPRDWQLYIIYYGMMIDKLDLFE